MVEQEIGELRETADWQERRKERLFGPEGLILGVDNARKLVVELREK